MFRSLRRLVALASLWLSAPVLAASVWLTDGVRVYAIDTLANRAIRIVSGAPIQTIATTSSGSAWVLTDQQLLAFEPQGTAHTPIDLNQLDVGGAKLLAPDPYDGTLWVAGVANRLTHLDAQGASIVTYTLPGSARALAVAQDQDVWVLGDAQVWHYGASGDLLQTLDLGDSLQELPTRLAIDSIGSMLWVGGQAQLLRIDLVNGARSTPLTTGSPIRDISLEHKSGTLWVLADDMLAAYDHEGTRTSSIDLAALGLQDVSACALDASDGTFWLGHPAGISRVSPAGELLPNPQITAPVSGVAALPFWIAPRLSLLEPAPGATTNPQPTFKLGVDALCNGVPCGLPPAYSDTFTLFASLDQDDVSKQLIAGPEKGQATLTPAQPLSAGAHRFSAIAVDDFGHQSNRIVADFAIATTHEDQTPQRKADSLAAPTAKPNQPPAVSLTAPANGAAFTAGTNITLSATASDSDGMVSNVDFYRGGATLIGGDAVSPYSIAWSNVPAGSYSLTAKATDNVGAVMASSAVNITVNAPANNPPTVSIASPASGTVFTTPASIPITANASDSDGTVAKVEFYQGTTLLSSATAAPYTFTWSNVGAGLYSLSAKVTDDKGATTISAAVAITVNAPPLVVLTQPAACSTLPASANVILQADAVDLDGSIVQVDFYQNGSLIGTTAQPSSPYGQSFSVAWSNVVQATYTLTAKATDNRGVTTTSTALSITVTSPNNPPSVTLTAPTDGATFGAGATVTLTATGSDSDGTVAKVDFFAGATFLGTATSSPYTIPWNPATAGSYTLTAKATDNLGASSTSGAVHIAVAANNPPSVALTAPTSGASYVAPGTVNFAASANDSDGTVAKVDFYAGSTLLGTATATPYAYAWANVTAGSYSLTAKATDNLGASTTSAVVSITVNSNNPPTVSLTAPASGASYSAPATVSLAATASDSDGTIAQVEFYDGATLLGTVNGGAPTLSATFTYSNVAAGTHSLTAKATDNVGATATSAAASITINPDAPPTVSLTAPANGATYFAPATINLSATAADSDGSIAKVNFYAGTTLVGTVTTSPYTFFWDNPPAGTYALTAIVTDNVGATATSAPASVTVKPGVMLSFATGLDGSTIGDDNALISGSASAPANSGVIVNGQPAQMDSAGNFYVNGLSLAVGANVVTVTLTGPDGQSATQTLNLTSTGPAPFAVTASPTEGFAPLSVTFTVTDRGNVAFQRVEFDFDGNGAANLTAFPSQFTDGVLSVLATYPAGTFHARVTAYDSSNAVIYTSIHVFTVKTVADTDAVLQSVYIGMLDRLRVGSINAALNAVTAGAHDKYNAVFNALASNLPAAIIGLGALQLSYISSDHAEYVLTRTSASGTQGFLIYFIRGGDGVWRIDGM